MKIFDFSDFRKHEEIRLKEVEKKLAPRMRTIWLAVVVVSNFVSNLEFVVVYVGVALLGCGLSDLAELGLFPSDERSSSTY